MRRMVAVIGLALGVAACATPRGSFCEVAPDLRYRQQVHEAMNDAEARGHLAYRMAGEKLCGWQR